MLICKKLSQNPCDKEALNRLLALARDWQYVKSERAKALKIFKLYLKCQPENGDVLFEAGRLELWMGKNKEAAVTLELAIELDPHNEDIAQLLTQAIHPPKKNGRKLIRSLISTHVWLQQTCFVQPSPLEKKKYSQSSKAL